MKKQTKQLIVLAVVLCAALGAYVGLRAWNGAKADREQAGDDPGLVELQELTQLSFTGADGETLRFTRQDGTWESGDEPGLPLRQSMLDRVEDAFCGLTAQRTLEQPDALSAYGLDPAGRTVTGTDAAGTSYTILLGDPVSSEGICYAMAEGGEVVWVVSTELLDATGHDLMELAEPEVLPELSEQTVQTIALTSADGELSLHKLTEKRQQTQEQETGQSDENGDPITEPVTSTVEEYHWRMEDDTSIPAGNEALTAALEALSGLSFSGVCAYRPTQAELEALGLDAPAAVLTVEHSGGTLSLELGGPDEEGTGRYARLAGSELVCLVPAGDVDALLSLTADALTAPA